MKAKILPDMVLLACGMAMWCMATFVPQCSFAFPYSKLLSGLIFLMGLLLSAFGNRLLSVYRTTSRPDWHSLSDVTTLVTSGVFRYTRNPIYLGMAIMLLGWTVFLENWLSALGVVFFVGFITYNQVIPEENALTKRFGESYIRYRNRVRRWL